MPSSEGKPRENDKVPHGGVSANPRRWPQESHRPIANDQPRRRDRNKAVSLAGRIEIQGSDLSKKCSGCRVDSIRREAGSHPQAPAHGVIATPPRRAGCWKGANPRLGARARQAIAWKTERGVAQLRLGLLRAYAILSSLRGNEKAFTHCPAFA